jgi:hypothetical protein
MEALGLHFYTVYYSSVVARLRPLLKCSETTTSRRWIRTTDQILQTLHSSSGIPGGQSRGHGAAFSLAAAACLHPCTFKKHP